MKLTWKDAVHSLRRYGPWVAARGVKFKILNSLGVLQVRRLFMCPSHECNADCVHCYEKFPGLTDEFLTTEEVKNVLDQFAALGGFVVHFCSGEFMMRKDCYELIRYAADKHIFVSVTTNGLLLNEQSIDKLKAAGARELVVSIDSTNAARHDELRGVPGAYECATNGLRLAAKKGLSTVIWTYVSKSNQDELESIAQLAEEVGAIYVLAFFVLLSGHFFNRFEENLTPEERDGFRRRFNTHPKVRLEFEEETDMCPGGGSIHVCVMPSGDVTFCPPVPYSYGNVRTKPLADALRDCLADHKRFCVEGKCRGQCIVNFPEYREHCNAKFMYGDVAEKK